MKLSPFKALEFILINVNSNYTNSTPVCKEYTGTVQVLEISGPTFFKTSG